MMIVLNVYNGLKTSGKPSIYLLGNAKVFVFDQGNAQEHQVQEILTQILTEEDVLIFYGILLGNPLLG